MPLANFSNLDFDQVKTTLRDYLKSNSNFTDYDFEGSNLSTILDVLAYNTYISSYNANMVANEVFIDTATLRENIVALARNIGYVPRSRKSARATVSFFVDTSNILPTPSSITLNKGIVATTTGSFGNESKTFCILDDITVPVFNNIASFNDISIYEGTLLSSNFTYSTRIPNQKFILPNSGVDTSLISVTVKNNENSSASTKYSSQDSLFDIGGESKVYFLQEISDERYEIFFGDNIFGKKLEEGNYITANYITSSGDGGNGITSFQFSGRLTYTRNAETYTVTSGISLLTTGLTSSGGDIIESVESIRRYAPRIYASQNRALTADDYETLIPARIYTETESISVFGGEELVPPQYGKVFISIKPRTGDFLPNLIKQKIKNKLKKFAVAGIVPEILDLKYLYIEVDSKVYYNTNMAESSAFVSSVVQNNANKYAESSELNKYGARFKYSKFLKIVDDSHESVTSNITTLRMRRDLRVVLNGFAEYQIGFGNRFQVKDPDGFNIKTSAFKVDGIAQDVYLGDLPRPDRETGTLFFFTLPAVGSQTPTIIRRNVGFIDYINGVITINPVNIQGGMVKDGQTIIEIEATPSSNDVIGLQDLYLQLDISNSNFETVVDEISSGLDPAGSTYIVTSSYPNGNLVREGGRGSIVRTSTPTTTSSRPTTTTSTTTTSVPSTTVSTSGSSTGGSGSGGGSGY
jgi:hypothetical protein|tara:strand:+ start:402 stop:2486 length:2085 start_codon:yes stop_codon:yes gene_type:complete